MRHPLQPTPARLDTRLQAERTRLRRWVSILTGVGLGGASVFAAVGATASAGVSSTTYTIGLDTAVAEPGEDCPDGPGAYWHFVLAPNGQGNFAFTGMVLDLDGEPTVIAPEDVLANGEQRDNVFVAVPAGSTLASLRTTMSTASYTSANGDQAKRWNLSHTCPGDVLEGEPEVVVDETVPTTMPTVPTAPTVPTTVPIVQVDETVVPTTAVPTSTTSTTTTTVLIAAPTATVAAAGPVPASAAAASAASAAGSIGAAAGGTLPTTGGSSLPFTQAACWAVVLGCCLVALHRRRRNPAG